MTQSWKLTLPCTRAEAEALSEDMGALADLTPPPALMTSEIEEDDPEKWQIDAYFEGRPPRATIALLQAMIPSSMGVKPVLEKLPDEDWVTLSQQGLEPIVAGRFHVRNHAEDAVPSGVVPLLIPAGRAFGTGQHETTAGCLRMLDRCRVLGERFNNLADIGTGTGLLAFAALHLWPRAFATASDIDPAAVEVSADNAAINGVATGGWRGEVSLHVAAGVDHAALHIRAPYDLVIANILAGPLIELAPSLCAVMEEGGTLILAGLLSDQADRVIAAYRAQGMRLVDRMDGDQWPTLRFRKRPAIGWKRPRRWFRDANGEAPGYGSW
ncbi:MAG: 50S ribosomal protein L11 methyltransferase [Sphingobium sp.]